jgi:hypothetical protein
MTPGIDTLLAGAEALGNAEGSEDQIDALNDLARALWDLLLPNQQRMILATEVAATLAEWAEKEEEA